MKLNIRLKLLIGFTLLLVISLLVQGVSFVLTKQYISSQISNFQETQTKKGVNNIQKFFATLSTTNLGFAKVYLENEKEATSAAKYLVKNNDYIREISVLSPLGKELLKFDSAGQVSPEELTYEVFSDPFKSAVAGTHAISKVYYFEDLGPHLDFFSPIVQENGQLKGIIKMQINLNQVSTELSDVRLGQSGYLYVVDEEGRLIAHPSKSFVLERPNLSSRKIVHNALINKQSNFSDERYVNEREVSVVAKAEKIPGYNWIIVLEQPVIEAFGFLDFIQNLFIVTSIGSSLFLLIIAFILSANLTRPIRKLEQSAQAVEKGQVETIAVIKSGDEIESLSHSFASLIDLLVQREHSLEKTTKELESANARLRRLDKLKDEFVSLASHELRTPMSAIKSNLWMSLTGHGGPLTDKQRIYLQRSYDSTERLMRLVNDMLNVSRIDSGRISIDLQPVALTDLTQQVFDEVMPHAEELGVSLTMQPTSLPQVLADPDKIKEVLFNLIGNALKFTPKGGAVTVSFAHNGDMIETTIRDTGTGIEKADMPKLFEKFGFIAGSYIPDRSLQGTGLGLYICKSIVELHKGRIWVNSEGRNKGTQFIFSLPVFHEGDLAKIPSESPDKQTVGLVHAGI